jgi:TetR/AcrR family transcriptional regulator, transcriptional repressor for nem operon
LIGRSTNPLKVTTVPTRERIVDAALSLFWERGYTRTGMADILERAAVLSGSFYHYFRRKEDVLLAVLDRYLEALEPEVLAPSFEGVADPLERIFSLLARYRQGVLQTDFAYRCPIGSLALEIGNLSPDARAKVEANFDAWRDAVAACLREKARGQNLRVDSAGLACFVLTTMEGAVMQACAQRSIAPFDRSVAHLRRYLAGLFQERNTHARPSSGKPKLAARKRLARVPRSG